MSKQKLIFTSIVLLLAWILALGLAVDSTMAQQIPGNASCKQLLDNESAYEIKVETPGINNGASYGPITFKDVNGGKTLMGYDSTVLVEAVFVKGGPNGGHLYSAVSYPAKYPAMSDTNMGTNGYGDGRYQISHVSFCWNEPPVVRDALTAIKTAEGTYDRTVEWTLTKSVDPDSHSGYAGEEAGSSTWTVIATKSESFGNYEVTGNITINNPNDIPVDFSVSDTLDDGTIATVSCPTYTVPANDSVICSYTALPNDAGAETNNAVVTSLTANVPGATANADIAWTENLIGYDSGTLSDPRVSYSKVINETTTETFPETFFCPADTSLYVNGEYSFIETNTATLNGHINLEASADVEVTCYLTALEVEKTADGEWDRTVTWDLEKFVDPASHSGHPGDSFDSIWTVVATKDDSGPQNFQVTGKIEIYNPASIAQSFSVVDELDDGTTATVTCEVNVVNPGETVECTYVAYPNDASATLNTATVAAAGNEPQVATDAVEWTENLEGYDSGTLSDPRFIYSEEISDSTTKTFPETFFCPADTSLYVNGIYEFTEVNWAYLNDNINLSASAEVDVTCYLPCEWIGETAWADGPRYTSRGNWATYTPYVPDSTVKLYAGQTMEAGTVHFSNAVDGKVTITIQLYEGWRFEDVAENVKIQDYAKAPSGNPAPGLFDHKAYADPNQNSFSIVVPENKFYGVHVNVEWEKCDFPLTLQETKSADNTRFLFLPFTTR